MVPIMFKNIKMNINMCDTFMDKNYLEKNEGY